MFNGTFGNDNKTVLTYLSVIVIFSSALRANLQLVSFFVISGLSNSTKRSKRGFDILKKS